MCKLVLVYDADKKSFRESKEEEGSQYVFLLNKEKDKVEIGTHIICINNYEEFDLDNWHFFPNTLFCDNAEVTHMRMEITATQIDTNQKYTFFGIRNYVDNGVALLNCAVEFINTIASCSDVKDIESVEYKNFIIIKKFL